MSEAADARRILHAAARLPSRGDAASARYVRLVSCVRPMERSPLVRAWARGGEDGPVDWPETAGIRAPSLLPSDVE